MNNLQKVDTKPAQVNPFRASNLTELWRVAEALSRSELVPTTFQQKPYNVMIALMCSMDLDINPFTVMSHMSVIHGKPRWEVKFLIALANRSGTFESPIDWKIEGKASDGTLTVTAWAILRVSGNRVEHSVSLAQAKADGWTKNSKYSTIPELMLRYRSAGQLIDLYCPEVRLGFGTDAEVDADSPAVLPVATEETPQTAPAVLPPPVQKRGPGRPRKDPTPVEMFEAPKPAQEEAPIEAEAITGNEDVGF